MRSVDELPALGFQDWGGSWVRQEWDFTVVPAAPAFHLQLGVYPDGTEWSRIDVYVSHDAAGEQLWWSFDLSGNETSAGGDHEAVLALYAEQGTDQIYIDLRDKASEAARSVLQQLQ